jgi:hypothetical protein
MSKLQERIANFLKREDGPTALGTNANKTFTNVANTIGSTAS